MPKSLARVWKSIALVTKATIRTSLVSYARRHDSVSWEVGPEGEENGGVRVELTLVHDH